MKKSLFSLMLFLTPLLTVFAQSSFELIIPWDSADTSSLGFKALEDAHGNSLILSGIDRYEHFPGGGVVIEGPPSLGTGITKISKSGQKIWSYLYPTQGIVTRGQSPSTFFMMNSMNEIILPYASYEGILFCYNIGEAIVGSESDKKAIMSIDSETGEIIQNEQYLNDYLCDRDKIIGIKETKWGYIFVYYSSALYIEKLDYNFEVIDTNTYEMYPSKIVLPEFEDKVLMLSSRKVSVFDYEANILQDYYIEVRDTVWGASISYAENETYHVIGMYGRDDYQNSDNYISTLYVLDKQFNTLSKKTCVDKTIRGVEISDNNEILALFDLSKGSWFDSIPKPVLVSQYDIDLNLIASGDYGFPYVNIGNISLTNDQKGFMVTGTRLTSIIDVEYGREADQIYFLKGQLSDLIVSNEITTQDLIGIKVFPNPTNDFIKIQIDDNKPFVGKINYALIDNYGRKIQAGLIENLDSTHKCNFLINLLIRRIKVESFSWSVV